MHSEFVSHVNSNVHSQQNDLTCDIFSRRRAGGCCSSRCASSSTCWRRTTSAWSTTTTGAPRWDICIIQHSVWLSILDTYIIISTYFTPFIEGHIFSFIYEQELKSIRLTRRVSCSPGSINISNVFWPNFIVIVSSSTVAATHWHWPVGSIIFTIIFRHFDATEYGVAIKR